MLLHENLQAEHGDTGVRGWPLSPGHPQHCPGWGWALRQPQDRPGGQSIPLEPALTTGQALPVTPVQHWECWRWGREAVLCSRQSSRAPGCLSLEFCLPGSSQPLGSGRAQTTLALLCGKETKPFFQDSWGNRRNFCHWSNSASSRGTPKSSQKISQPGDPGI